MIEKKEVANKSKEMKNCNPKVRNWKKKVGR